MLISQKDAPTIGIIAPSFFIEKKENFAVGLEYMKKKGFNLKFGNTIFNKLYNTTGTAIERARDINAMFKDPYVDIIVASDGGCKAIEVLEYLDYELIKSNPKPICGFSDITHILLAIYSKTRNSTIHGIDVINGFGQDESFIKDRNLDLFWKLIENDSVQMNLQTTRILKKGNGIGVIVGGWLNAIQHLVGTDYFPQEEKIVLFWETIDEEPNKINMMLRSLRLAGLFDHLAGMVVGKLESCIEKEYYDCIPGINEIILEACDGYNFPILTDAPFGHGEEKCSFKLGTKIKINTEKII